MSCWIYTNINERAGLSVKSYLAELDVDTHKEYPHASHVVSDSYLHTTI